MLIPSECIRIGLYACNCENNKTAVYFHIACFYIFALNKCFVFLRTKQNAYPVMLEKKYYTAYLEPTKQIPFLYYYFYMDDIKCLLSVDIDLLVHLTRIDSEDPGMSSCMHF